MPDYNNGAGAAFSYKLERDVVGFISKNTTLGYYTGDVNSALNTQLGGNAFSLLNGGPLGAGMGYYLGVGNFTSGADNMEVLLGAKSAEKAFSSNIDLHAGFESSTAHDTTVSGISIKYRPGQIMVTKVNENTGFSATGAMFSTITPDTDFCYSPFPDSLMQDPSLRRTYGGRPNLLCSAQLGSSVALGKIWNPNPAADHTTDNHEIISGAPIADRVFIWTTPPGASPNLTTYTVIKPVPSVTLASFSTFSSISAAARAALEWGSYFGESVASGSSLNGDKWDG